MIVGMVATSFTSCGRTDLARQQMMQTDPGAVVATVGNQQITERLIGKEMERIQGMYGGQASNLPASFQLQMEASVLRSTVGNILQIELAKKYGVKASDQDLAKILTSGVESEISGIKQQLVNQGKLKADATEAEFAELFKKEVGRELSSFKKEAIDSNLSILKSGADLKIPVEALAVGEPLMAALKKEIKLSDEDLKKSYDTFEVKRITLSKGDPNATAKKIEAEIKGGLSFEQAMDRYSEAQQMDPKKKLSEQIDPLPRTTVQGFPAYSPIEKLKPGEVSAPVTIGQSVNIFKLIQIKNELPKDFNEKKETYRDTQVSTLAAARMQSELMDMQKNANVDWKVPAYKWLYEYGRLTADNLDAADRNKLEEQIMNEAMKAATESNAEQAKTASLLAYVTFESIYARSSATEKTKLDETKIKIYETYLVDNEDPQMRLELARTYKNQKKEAEFAGQLIAAANANLGGTDPQAQGTYNTINDLIREGETAKLLTAEQVKELKELQKLWVEQKAEQDKADAEAKKLEAEAAKAAADAEKKSKEEAAKNVKTREELEKEKAGKSGGKQ